MRRFVLFALAPIAASLVVTGCGSGTAGLPTATGGYGEKPTITFPDGKPSKTLQSKTLVTGTGATIAKGDLLSFDYLGQIWNGKVFDNSYDRHQPLIEGIGVGNLIKGWDKSLVGDTLGSRVLLVVPPADGYGDTGQPQAGIGKDDTLVFVIDLIAAYKASAGGDPHAKVVAKPPAGLTVTGALGSAAHVHVAKGTAEPKKAKVILLARGSGAPVKSGEIVVQYEAVDWGTNKVVRSTAQIGRPTAVGIKTPGQTSSLDKLAGIPVGSRVLVLIPATKASGSTPAEPAAAVVLDIVAQAQTAAEAAAS